MNFRLGTLSRFAYPGALVALFAWKELNKPNYFNVLLFVLIGLVIYPIYKTTFWWFARWVLAKSWLKIPQYELHKNIVDKLLEEDGELAKHITDRKKRRLKSLFTASAVLSFVLKDSKSADQHDLYEVNGNVHVLYLTAFLALPAFLYYLASPLKLRILSIGIEMWIVCVLVFLGTFILGLYLDRNIADMRETLIITDCKDKYREVLKQFAENL